MKNAIEKMKRILPLILLAFAINSCSVGDEDPVNGVALLAIESVSINEIYQVNSTSEITVTYRRPTDCYIFDGFYVTTEGLSSTIAVQAVELSRNDCMDDSMNTFDVPLEFNPTVPGEYQLKFYAGSLDGVAQYHEYNVIVE